MSDNPYLLRWLTGREPVVSAPGDVFFTGMADADHVSELRVYVRQHTLVFLVLVSPDTQPVMPVLAAAGVRLEPYRSGPGYRIDRLRPAR